MCLKPCCSVSLPFYCPSCPPLLPWSGGPSRSGCSFRAQVGWGIFVAGWGLLLVSSIDNVLRPYLLTQANSLPVLLSFFGFLGGILAFGLIGLFLGPVLLAVGYSLFLEWQATDRQTLNPPGDFHPPKE